MGLYAADPGNHIWQHLLENPEDFGTDGQDFVEIAERVNTRVVSETLSSKEHVRIIKVKAISLEQALGDINVPQIGSRLSQESFKVCVSRRGLETEIPGIYDIECIYNYPAYHDVAESLSTVRQSWSISPGSEFWEVDLDGNPIGFREFVDEDGKPTGEIDEDAQLGMEVQKVEISFSLQMPSPSKYDPAFFSQFWNKVNDRVFFQIQPGFCLYTSCNADWVGPGPKDFKVTHNFKLGQVIMPDLWTQHGKYIPIKNGIFFSFQKVDGQRKPKELFLSRLYEEANFDSILTYGENSNGLSQGVSV